MRSCISGERASQSRIALHCSLIPASFDSSFLLINRNDEQSHRCCTGGPTHRLIISKGARLSSSNNNDLAERSFAWR